MNNLPEIPLSEEDYERFEEQIPALAERATREAYERALQAGLPVAVTIGNSVVEVKKDGSIRKIKRLPPTRQCIHQRFFKLE